MKRTSPYHPLAYRVDYNAGRFWETIAAFNSDRVAASYADDCRKAKRGLTNPPQYRTMKRTSKGWVEFK